MRLVVCGVPRVVCRIVAGWGGWLRSTSCGLVDPGPLARGRPVDGKTPPSTARPPARMLALAPQGPQLRPRADMPTRNHVEPSGGARCPVIPMDLVPRLTGGDRLSALLGDLGRMLRDNRIGLRLTLLTADPDLTLLSAI